MTIPRSILAGLVSLLAVALATTPATAAPHLSFSAGSYDVGGTRSEPLEAGLELHLAPRRLRLLPPSLELRPMLGAAGTSDGAAWAYAGLRGDLSAGAGWLVSPSFAVAFYKEGDGKDLGGPVEFRSGIEVARRLGAGSRLGLSFYHLSNAGIYDRNPGSNSLVLVYTLAFQR